MTQRTNLLLIDLHPEFVKTNDSLTYSRVNTIQESEGILFECPCGSHYLLCWNRGVPPTYVPTGGRWDFSGTGFDDLSLSPSILIDTGCECHFYIQQGKIR